MDTNFNLIPTVIINKLAITEIISCNKITSHYGLILSHVEAQELVETREEALGSNGRIEFAGGIINKIIMKFCDSPFISQFNYAAIMNELVETFYYYKNETLDEISDDDLISLMKKYFDHSCQGSIELLQSRELEILAHNIRFGISNFSEVNDDADVSHGEVDNDEQS